MDKTNGQKKTEKYGRKTGRMDLMDRLARMETQADRLDIRAQLMRTGA